MTRPPDTHRSDLRLVRDALAGDRQAVDGFIARMRCVPLILAARNARLGNYLNRDELTDLVQETLATVWRKLDGFAGESALESWVYGICHNNHMNAIRSKRRHLRLLEDQAEPVEPGGDPALAAAFEYEQVHLGLERLEERQAAVIRLKHFGALTFEQIAARLDMSTNTAKTHYYRGLERMRGFLRPHFQGEYA